MAIYYRDLTSGEIVTNEQAWEEAYERVDYSDALSQLIHYYSADVIIHKLSEDMRDMAFDLAAEQYMDENFEECDEPEEEKYE